MSVLWAFWHKIKGYGLWIAAAVSAVFAVVFSYKRRIGRAEEEGAEAARREVTRATAKETAKMEARSGEVREDIADLDDDDLRERMRDEARRQSRR